MTDAHATVNHTNSPPQPLRLLHTVRSAAFLSALLLLSACKRETPAFRDAPVILISIDTLRADHLPAYGYGGISTPALDAFRRDSVLFRYAYSPCPMTLPAHVSMLTGLLPFEHGVRDNVGFAFDVAKTGSLPTTLRGRGYATGAAVSSFVMRGETGLASAFEWFDDALDSRRASSSIDMQRPGDRTARAAQGWIDANAARPFFFFLHLYEPHVPYRDTYDKDIVAADKIVGDFIAHLKRTGVYDRAIVVITSDHGEGLGDHGEKEHSILLYNELIRVPLMIKLPQSQRAGTDVNRVAGISDIAPTLLALTTGEKGRSLFDSDDARAAYSESYYARLHLGWSEVRSVVRGPLHYIESSRPELYDVRSDPREVSDLSAQRRRDTASMKELLRTFPSDLPQPEAIDPETARNLSALGYLASSAPASANGPLPNPRDRIGDFEKLRSALGMIAAGRNGRPLFDEVVRANPRMSEAWMQLAETYGRAGNADEAIAAYREALTRGGTQDEILLGIAEMELQRGRSAEAVAITATIRTNNVRRLNTLKARASLATRDVASAERFARELADSPAALPGDVLLLAEVLARRGDAAGASSAIARAEEMAQRRGELPLYRADYLRGEMFIAADKPQEAIAAYEREIAAFPANMLAYSHLAVVHVVVGNRTAGDKVLERLVAANPGPAARQLAASTLESVEDFDGAAKYRRWVK